MSTVYLEHPESSVDKENYTAMPSSKVAGKPLRRHPLQRLTSPSRGASAVLHVLGLASFGFSFRHLIVTPNPIINDSYGWHMQYLTIIGLALASLTFLAGLLADISLSTTLFNLKNTLSVASAPIECLISIMYWGLWSIDPKLVLPEWSPVLPIYIDLSFHAAPSIALIIDLLFFSPPYTITFLPALGLSAFIGFGYWFWIERCYSFNEFYPYPIFDLLSIPQRVALFAVAALLMAIATSTLVWLYGVINGKELNNFGDKVNEKTAHRTNRANNKSK